jgi:uncharacterized protein (TIGR03382 family)
MRPIPFACFLAVLSAPALAAPVAPHASWHQAPLSNGFAAGVYDTQKGKLSDLWTHPYAEGAPGAVTPDLLYDAFFGTATGGSGLWLPTLPPLTASYENGTGILAIVREVKGVRYTERWFAPMHREIPCVAGMLTVRNLGDSPVQGLRLFSLHNFHVGTGSPEASSAKETVTFDPKTGAFVETGAASNRTAVARPLVPTARHAASPDTPFESVPKTGSITDSGGGKQQDDAISAFQWDVPELAPSAEHTVGVLLCVADSWTAKPYDPSDPAGPGILDDERAWWKDFHSRDVLPGVNGNDLALARQSLAVLAMAQVREPDSADRHPHGQVLASLPPGGWNRTWVRDQTYASVALAAAGHVSEAADSGRFILGGTAGGYTAQVGVPYLVTVCRYYGWGGEESDGNPDADGPNIEFDGFGLFLWHVAEVASRPGGKAFADTAWPKVKPLVADVLVSLVESQGLVRADSSIWEEHWNGRQRHFTYTNATTVLGLCAAADLAEARGDPAAGTYRATARMVASAMRQKLVSANGILAGNLEELATGKGFLDAAAIEAFNWGILDPSGAEALATLDAFGAGLAMAKTGHGFMRNDDGDWYDRQEWTFIDLRLATAMRAAGRTGNADTLAAWVVDQSRSNLDLVAELYSEDLGDYAGAVPMGGFGAGAFLLWRLDPGLSVDVPACLAAPGPETGPEPAEPDTGTPVEESAAVPDAADPGPAPDPGPPPTDPGPDTAPGMTGGGCGAGGVPVPFTWAVFLTLAAFRRARR